MAGGGVGVCVNESAQGGGVISALEIIEAGFFDEGLSLSAIWGGFMLVKKLIKLRSGRQSSCRRPFFLPVQKECKVTPEGEDSESLPPLDSPHSNGQKGVPFWISPCKRAIRQKSWQRRGNRKGELPDGQSARRGCHSERSEESVAMVFQENRQREADPSTSHMLRSG